MKHDHFTGTLDSAISQLRCNPQIVDAAEWKKKKKKQKTTKSSTWLKVTGLIK